MQNPVSINIRLDDSQVTDQKSLHASRQKLGRKLLDADKIMFKTNHLSYVIVGDNAVQHAIALVSAERQAVSRNGVSGGFITIEFDIGVFHFFFLVNIV